MEPAQTVKHEGGPKRAFLVVANEVLFGPVRLSDGALVTYLAVSSHDWWEPARGGRKGYVFPSLRRLAELRRTTIRTVQRHLGELIRAGLIVRYVRPGRSNLLQVRQPQGNLQPVAAFAVPTGRDKNDTQPATKMSPPKKKDERKQDKEHVNGIFKDSSGAVPDQGRCPLGYSPLAGCALRHAREAPVLCQEHPARDRHGEWSGAMTELQVRKVILSYLAEIGERFTGQQGSGPDILRDGGALEVKGSRFPLRRSLHQIVEYAFRYRTVALAVPVDAVSVALLLRLYVVEAALSAARPELAKVGLYVVSGEGDSGYAVLAFPSAERLLMGVLRQLRTQAATTGSLEEPAQRESVKALAIVGLDERLQALLRREADSLFAWAVVPAVMSQPAEPSSADKRAGGRPWTTTRHRRKKGVLGQ